MQADTIVPEPGNPLALDRYGYVYNNPLKYTDPEGEFIWAAVGVVILFVGFSSILTTDTRPARPEEMPPPEQAWAGMALTFGAPLVVEAPALGPLVYDSAARWINFSQTPAGNIVNSAAEGAFEACVEGQCNVEGMAIGAVSEVIIEAPLTLSQPKMIGEFSIYNWNDYPEGMVPKPEGPFRIIDGVEYQTSRAAANKANALLHQSDDTLRGLHLHEIQPVKFNGSPTDIDNKMALTPSDHARYTVWWNRLQRKLESQAGIQ
jgi:hypothetical protein